MDLAIIFHHPKDLRNLADVARIAARLGARLLVVSRPGRPDIIDYAVNSGAYVASSLEEAIRLLGSDYELVVLESYGDTCIEEYEPSTERIALIIGAEDYGVPRQLIERLPVRPVIAKIPMAVQGMSYNVVVALAIALMIVTHKLKRMGRLRGETWMNERTPADHDDMG
ncbi:MAG: TrmH family RNA methyltransferase [Pyrodictiaceae archaeon]